MGGIRSNAPGVDANGMSEVQASLVMMMIGAASRRQGNTTTA